MIRKEFKIIADDFGEAIVNGDIFSVQDFINTMKFKEGTYKVYDESEKEVHPFGNI